ncbi:MAG: redoxin family protein [Robiginitomaculum sp.]|nr:redoxin family protein [Robiginitomaculum sp.]
MKFNRRIVIGAMAALPLAYKANAQSLPEEILELMNHPAAGYFEAPPADSGVPMNIPITTATGTYSWMQMFMGKAVLLDLWASWCTPCLVETPGLDALASKLNSPKFSVIVLKTADPKTSLGDLAKFYHQQQINTLTPMQGGSNDGWGFFRSMKVNTRNNTKTAGLPMAALIDTNGREIARTYGSISGGKWNNPQIADFIAKFSKAWS